MPDNGPPVTFNKDGSVDLLGKHLDPPTVDQLERLFEIDERQRPNPDAEVDETETKTGKGDWKFAALFLSEALEVFGYKVPVGDLPAWSVQPSFRRALLQHWITIPFDLPPSNLLTGTTRTVAPSTHTIPTTTAPAPVVPAPIEVDY